MALQNQPLLSYGLAGPQNQPLGVDGKPVVTTTRRARSSALLWWPCGAVGIAADQLHQVGARAVATSCSRRCFSACAWGVLPVVRRVEVRCFPVQGIMPGGHRSAPSLLRCSTTIGGAVQPLARAMSFHPSPIGGLRLCSSTDSMWYAFDCRSRKSKLAVLPLLK